MFTGIVEATSLARAELRGSGARLRVPAPAPDWDVRLGDSVAVSGCCLTVAALLRPGSEEAAPAGQPGADMVFDLSAETLARTWLGADRARPRVNLERALRVGDRLGGHLVTGHVDGVGRCVSVEEDGAGGRVLGFEVPEELARYLVEKGSMTVDGVSLTVVAPRGRRFRVAAIPYTLEVTTLSELEPGRAVHLEADAIGKWIERLMPGARA